MRPKVPGVDELGCLEPVPRRQHTVARSGCAASLNVAEHGDARLVAGAILDLAGELRADTAEDDVAELVGRTRLAGDQRLLARGVGELVALADDDDREVLARLVPLLEQRACLLDRHRLLGDQDHVRAARDAGVHRDPAGVAAHHLDDHHAVVRLGRRVQPVDRLGRDRDRGVEAEGVVGRVQVVVDRLRDADDRESRARRGASRRRRACPRRRSRRARRAPRSRTWRAPCRRRPRPCRGSCATCRGSCRRAAGSPRPRAGRAARRARR